MAAVTLAEFLEGLSIEARTHQSGSSQLLVPEPLKAEVAELLAQEPIDVEAAPLGEHDILVGFTPENIMTAFWTPGLSETELETYQTLREDGMEPTRARETAQALEGTE